MSYVDSQRQAKRKNLVCAEWQEIHNAERIVGISVDMLVAS